MISTKTILILLFAFLFVSAVFAADAGAAKKAAGAKTEEVKSATKPVDTKPVDTKPVDTKPVETKPVETKPVETKPVDTKPVDTKPVDTKPKPVETKPVDTQHQQQQPKVETKEQPKKAAPKADSQPNAGGSAVDDIQKQALVFLHKAQVQAEHLFAEARILYVKYGQIAHDNAERIVDKYFSVQNAVLLKTNFFNIYGVLALSLGFFILAFFSSKIDWVFSLNPVRAFLSAFGLGVFFTLYGFTHLVKDPAALVAKNAPEAIESLEVVALGWFATLLALNFASVLRGGVRNLIQFITSGLLFVEYFELKHHIEAHTGSLPPYSLILLAFAVLTFLSFAQLEASINPAVVYKVGYQVNDSNTPTKEKINKANKKKTH